MPEVRDIDIGQWVNESGPIPADVRIRPGSIFRHMPMANDRMSLDHLAMVQGYFTDPPPPPVNAAGDEWTKALKILEDLNKAGLHGSNIIPKAVKEILKNYTWKEDEMSRAAKEGDVIVDIPFDKNILDSLASKVESYINTVKNEEKSVASHYETGMKIYRERRKESKALHEQLAAAATGPASGAASIRKKIVDQQLTEEQLDEEERYFANMKENYIDKGDSRVKKCQALVDKLKSLSKQPNGNFVLFKYEVKELGKHAGSIAVAAPKKYEYYPSLKAAYEKSLKEMKDSLQRLQKEDNYVRLIHQV